MDRKCVPSEKNKDTTRFYNTLSYIDLHFSVLKATWVDIKKDVFKESDKETWKVWSNLFKEFDYENNNIPVGKHSPEGNLKRFYDFRNSLVDYILKIFCVNQFSINNDPEDICLNVGSSKFNSDIDITIKTRKSNIYVNISTLNTIVKFLDEFFDKKTTNFDYNKFLDINFYLTDFQITKPTDIIQTTLPLSSTTISPLLAAPSIRNEFLNLENICISSYYSPEKYVESINLDYKKQFNNRKLYPSQFQYAFYEYLYFGIKRPKILDFEYDMIVRDIYILKNKLNIIYQEKNIRENTLNTLEDGQEKEAYIIEHNKKEEIEKKDIQLISDLLVTLCSQLSTVEDETYHTQGSYIHVVTLIQRSLKLGTQILVRTEDRTDDIMNDLLKTSIIENACFSYTHFDNIKKLEKYLTRVLDGFIRLYNTSLSKYNYSIQVYAKLRASFNFKEIISETRDIKDKEYKSLFDITQEILLKILSNTEVTNVDKCNLRDNLDRLYDTLIMKKLNSQGGGKNKKQIMTKTNNKILLNNGKNYNIYLNNRGTKYIKTKGNYELLIKHNKK